MKIAQINAVCGVGSTGRTTSQLHEYLTKNGHDSYVFWAIKAKNAQKDQRLIKIGNKFDHKLHAVLSRVFFNQAFNSRLATKKLIKQLKKINPDVVHLRNLHSNYINFNILLKYLKDYEVPVVLTLHDCWFFTGGCFHYKLNNCEGYTVDCANCPSVKTKKQQRKREKIFAIKKDAFSALSNLSVLGVSQWTSESAKKSAIFNDTVNHSYIYNWIDLENFRPCGDQAKVREKYGLKEKSKIILGVAQSWKSAKGFETFNKLSELVDDNTEVVLVGDSNGRQSTSTLKFIGRTESQKELAELYSIANVFVNPSPAETFGKVTAEALACGVPVVAYDNKGTTELVKDICGWLVNDGDEQALINQVLKSLTIEDKNQQERINFVRENFDFNKQAEKYVKLYQEISKKRK